MSDTAVNYRPLAAGDRLGEWRLAARLGENEAGDVWRVRHHALEREAAVIVATDPVQAAVLRVSGEAHQRVSHPRVVQTLGLDLDHQPPYLVLAWVDGESLRTRLNRGRLIPAEAVRIVQEILEGLEPAHALRICHGALRPERVQLEGGAEVRLTGFGTPPAAAETDGAVVISEALDLDGARQARLREYVAPELRGGAAATVAGDLYSVGVIAFEMLTGRLPAGAETARDLNPEVPEPLSDTIRKACGRVELRYHSVAELRAALTGRRANVPHAQPVAIPVAKRLPTAAPIRIGHDGEVAAADADAPVPGIRLGEGKTLCPTCKRENPVDHRYCTGCGRGLQGVAATPRVCPNCHVNVPNRNRHCARCGTEVPAR